MKPKSQSSTALRLNALKASVVTWLPLHELSTVVVKKSWSWHGKKDLETQAKWLNKSFANFANFRTTSASLPTPNGTAIRPSGHPAIRPSISFPAPRMVSPCSKQVHAAAWECRSSVGSKEIVVATFVFPLFFNLPLFLHEDPNEGIEIRNTTRA
jgi:hypothetical protein